ncbi:MAG: hypothetical protein JWL72_3294 [Ilumatobacteraceae bacterium]|nr:hypothetical protein [Ilumatobacteraceae bacterium]
MASSALRRLQRHMARHERRALVVVLIWLLGAAWILIPHPGEGHVLVVISTQFELGVHLTDPVGVVVPAIVTVALYWPELRRAATVQRSASRSRAKLR